MKANPSPLDRIAALPYLLVRYSRLVTWLVFLFLYVPIVILVIFSFNRAPSATAWGGLSLRWYRALWADETMQEHIGNSLTVAALSTLLATLIGTLAALGMARPAFRGKAATGALLFLPIIIPEIVIGAALLTFFSVTHWHLSLGTVVVAHVAFSVSYVAIVVRARLAGFDPSLEEAAADLGASPLGAFLRVKLPLMMPGVLAGALLAFTVSIDDYVITSFVAGPTATTLPLHIASELHTKTRLPEINAAATLLLIFTALLIGAAQWLLRDKHASNAR